MLSDLIRRLQEVLDRDGNLPVRLSIYGEEYSRFGDDVQVRHRPAATILSWRGEVHKPAHVEISSC